MRLRVEPVSPVGGLKNDLRNRNHEGKTFEDFLEKAEEARDERDFDSQQAKRNIKFPVPKENPTEIEPA